MSELQLRLPGLRRIFSNVPYEHMGTFGFFPFGLLGGLTGLLFFAGLVLLIFVLIRAVTGPHAMRWTPAAPPQVPAESPLDILARRFAAGAITAEEYQRARDVLREKPPA